jgi:hypothetical protein
MIRSHIQSRILAVTAMVLTLVACSGAQPGQPGATAVDAPSPAAGSPGTSTGGSSAGGGSSLTEAAIAVTDACTLMPMDLAATIVPNAGPPQSQPYPPYRCTVSNGTSVLEITIAPYDVIEPPDPSEPVAGVGAAAYVQKQFVDDAYLKVILEPDGGVVYVEVAGHDGKDHEDDAIAVAKRVLAALQ